MFNFGRGQHGFYDALGRPESVTQDPNSANVQSIHYGYDNLGNRIGMRTEINDVVQSYVTYEHDDLNRITGVFDHDAAQVPVDPDSWFKDGTVVPTQFDYNPLGQMISISRPNDVTTTYTYGDIANIVDIPTNRSENPYQVYEIDHSHDVDGLISQYSYEYDGANNRSGMNITTPDGSGGTDLLEIDYLYDRANRMIEESYELIGGATSDTQYAYDRAGNRTQMRDSSGDITRYSYNANDELTRVDMPDYYFEDYSYDSRGNLTLLEMGGHGTYSATNYDYNARDQLISAIVPGSGTVTYDYDYRGNRIEQNIGAVTTDYLWDEFSRYGDVILESTPTNTVSYTLASEMLISQNNAGNVDYFLQDAQGSTVGIADETGTVTSSYSYNAFGELDDSSTLETNYLYTGQQFDSDTELYSLRARYYDPGKGRFTSRDKWAYDYQNPVELNRYAYARNNPATYSDPSGYLAIDLGFLSGFNTVVATAALPSLSSAVSSGIWILPLILGGTLLYYNWEGIAERVRREGTTTDDHQSRWLSPAEQLALYERYHGQNGDSDPGDIDPGSSDPQNRLLVSAITKLLPWVITGCLLICSIGDDTDTDDDGDELFYLAFGTRPYLGLFANSFTDVTTLPFFDWPDSLITDDNGRLIRIGDPDVLQREFHRILRTYFTRFPNGKLRFNLGGMTSGFPNSLTVWELETISTLYYNQTEFYEYTGGTRKRLRGAKLDTALDAILL